MTNPKRTAALAAFDRLADGHRQSLATSEKALADLHKIRTLVKGSELDNEALAAECVAARNRAAYWRDIVTISEYEREVLFGAEEPAR